MIWLFTTLAVAGEVLDDGSAVRAVRSVTPFSLTTPYAYEWSADHRMVTNGALLVLDVDPAWLVPSDARQAVLYVGDTPAERIAGGWPSGRIVVLVPGDVSPEQSPIYFGGVELPERVDRSMGRATRVEAERKGIRPLPVTQVAAQSFATREALLAHARTLAE